MIKYTTADEIVFRCRCSNEKPGGPYDTLMAEEVLETTEVNLKYETFIDTAAQDIARNIICEDCPKCGLDYLTIIRIGVNENVMYICECGWRATYNEYMLTKTKKSE